jgi:hypothetical protein
MLNAARLVTVLLAVCVWLVVPLTVGQWGRVPHTHVLIGHVTELDMAEHLAREQPHAAAGHHEENLPHWESGWILSVPFGNPGALFVLLFTLALAQAVELIQRQVSSFLVLRGFATKQVYLVRFPPPPRTDFFCERVCV